MKPPFNLIRIFSISSFLATFLLTLGLSWLLSMNLEEQLSERDKQLTSTSFIMEVMDEMGDFENLSFIEITHNPEFQEEMLEFLGEIHGALKMDILNTTGVLLWSTDPKSDGIQKNNLLFSKAVKGEILINFQESPDDQEEFISTLYIPLIQDEKVLGIFILYRQSNELHKQIQIIKYDVYWYCALFGLGLYFAMMLIIFPAARILNKQHQQLIDTQQQLMDKERLSAIGEVCGAVAHGLKNPISSVRAAVQLLSLRKVEEEQRKSIAEKILHEVDRLSKRLQDLLDFIRPFDPDLQYTDLKDVLNNVIRTLSWKADKENLKFIQHQPEDPVTVYIDASLIEEAILIIISNAMEASEEGSTIECSIEKFQERNAVVIRDYGVGIPQKSLPHIFEQFFTTRSNGVGLGLALCKKIMDIHQSMIQIESIESQGTIVRLLFPNHIK